MEPVPEEDDKLKEKKITQLLLNTSGACFLCLQDNQTDEDLNGGIIDLNNICRYLNIDQCSLLLTSLKSDGGAGVEEFEQGQCTFSVNLCQKCQELTEKLNDMIIQLEKAKLLVNFHLKSFHKLLEGNGGEDWEETLEWINLLGRMHANSNNSFEAKLVQLLREEAKDKSLKILKKAEAAKPQVILPKLTSPPPLPPPAPCFNTSMKTSGGPAPSIKSLLNHLVTSSVIPSKKSRKSKPKLYRCPHCPKILSISKFAIHLACQHSDKLLSSHFPPPCPPPSESLCRQVLHSQVISKAQKVTSLSTASPRLGCHLCGITYSDATLLKHHFLITHTDNLYQAIIHFIKNPQKEDPEEPPSKKRRCPPPSSSEASKSVNTLIKNLMDTSLINPSNHDKNIFGGTDKANKRYQCPFCGVSSVHSKFALHLCSVHPDKLLDPVTPSIDKHLDDNPNHFKEICGKVLASQVTKATKTLVSTTRGGGAGTTSSMSSKLCCHLCARRYSDGRHLKHHFLVNHTDHLCEELIKIEKDKPKKKADKPLKKVKRKRIFRNRPEDKTCSICGQAFSKYDKLKGHLMRQHPEQLFLECKPREMGGDQWRETCKRFFGGEVSKATYGRAGGKIYRCGYCPPGGGEKSYRRHVDLVVHLAYHHREEMEGKLKIYSGGDLGGDEHMVIEEEDGSDFDVKLEEIEEMDEDAANMDDLLDEFNDMEEEEGYREEEDDKLDPLQQLYGELEEGEGGNEGLEVPENENQVKEEANEIDDAIYSEIY